MECKQGQISRLVKGVIGTMPEEESLPVEETGPPTDKIPGRNKRFDHLVNIQFEKPCFSCQSRNLETARVNRTALGRPLLFRVFGTKRPDKRFVGFKVGPLDQVNTVGYGGENTVEAVGDSRGFAGQVDD